ncbi:MAG: GAF domain-containing protein [Calditrichaeota bacterium]|nr:MAG: GAF domain-containing protein [Calditrichota bacterium]
MSLFDLLTVVGFGFGTALTIILFSLSMQRMPKRPVDIAFGILFLAFIFWFGSNFIAVLVNFLMGSVARPEINVLLLLAYLGLCITPSSLLHIQIASLLNSGQLESRLSKRHILILSSLYIPAVIFIILYASQFFSLTNATPGKSHLISTPFIIWMLISMTASAAFSEKLIKILEHVADRRFYRDMTYVLSFIGLGVVFIYIFSFHRLPYIGPYLDLIMLLSPALPMGVLLYYVYRYNFYRLIVKPSLVYSILYGLFMAVYLLGIRRVGEYLRQFPEINADLIEGLLLIALVFAFQPFRSAFHRQLDKLFFKDRYYYQQFLRELSDSISSIVDLEELMQAIRKSLIQTLQVRECIIVIFTVDNDQAEIIKSTGHGHVSDLQLLINAVQATAHFRLRRQIHDHRVMAALRINQLTLAVPINYQEQLHGLICLEQKESGNVFSDEELDVLQTFSNQIGLAFENARLVQERLELIGRIYQSEKLYSLGQLATTLSHEIKNPLSSIKTIIQVLHEKAEGEEKTDLSLVLDEILRLQAITGKLLSFARPAGTNIERLYVQKIIQDVAALLQHQAKQAKISLQLFLDSVPPIEAKPQAIREIVYNLMLNAIQSIPSQGEVDVFLKIVYLNMEPRFQLFKKHPLPSSILKLEVKDTGSGIAPEMIGKIFDPFYTLKTKGTGLGLTIVKRNVEELGASIEVESTLGKGSTFTVNIPLNNDQQDSYAKMQNPHR